MLNVGDQWSDLQGGYADKVLKLPNPTYFLPSPDLDGTPADRAFSPRSRFTMKPDGSSGATEGGEGIPNIDIVKTTIRTYYKATSRHRRQERLALHPRAATGPRSGSRRAWSAPAARPTGKGQHPVVVLDADDTTLWTYDMEDGAMNFNFNPTVQNDEWVQPQRFPATPGMVALTKAVDAAGCTWSASPGATTPRRTPPSATWPRSATPGSPRRTTTPSGSAAPCRATARGWPGTPCADGVCTTIEYKSLTRKHVAAQGHRIVANLGDQFSDLIGGYADRAVKLPNPTYYLP